MDQDGTLGMLKPFLLVDIGLLQACDEEDMIIVNCTQCYSGHVEVAYAAGTVGGSLFPVLVTALIPLLTPSYTSFFVAAESFNKLER